MSIIKKCRLLSELRIKYQRKDLRNDNFNFGIASGYRFERVRQKTHALSVWSQSHTACDKSRL